MPAYSFSLADFEWMIPKGRKWRTTRLFKDGKRYQQALKAKWAGRPVRLYWKQRTKQCKLLLESQIISVYKVVFTEKGAALLEPCSSIAMELDMEALSNYAYQEGFETWQDFVKAVEELHGPDFREHIYYTVEWVRPEATT